MKTNMKGSVFTLGELPTINSIAPDFLLTKNDLRDVVLKSFTQNNIILNIFPSIDTQTCATSTIKFNEKVSKKDDTVVLAISKDLPFAQSRFCQANNIDKVVTLSSFRDDSFNEGYGVTLMDGPLKGLFARAVILIKYSKIVYTELVSELSDEPNYEKILNLI